MVRNELGRCKWGLCKTPVTGKRYCEKHRAQFNATQRKYRNQTPKARWSHFINQCKQRALFSELTFEQFIEITSKPCDYCGESAKTHRGIDRIDSSIGYTSDNSVPCCWDCNRAKSDLSRADFFAWIRRITQHFLTNKRSITNLQEVKIK